MKELQERIEECLVRLKELPALIRAEREKMNGKAAIEELKTRLKGLWLEYLDDATEMIREKTDKAEKSVKLYPNEKARESYALQTSKHDPAYQQISEEIKRFEHQRSTATMNHEVLVKEHSGLISTVDVLREMLKIARISHFHEMEQQEKRLEERTTEAWLRVRKEIHQEEQEASNEEG